MKPEQIIGRSLIVTLQGELDLHTAPPLKERLDRLLDEEPGLRHLILDVGEVSFIDSSGLGVILGRYKTIEQRSGKLVFVGCRPQVKRVLEFSGFRKIAVFAKSPQEALEMVERT